MSVMHVGIGTIADDVRTFSKLIYHIFPNKRLRSNQRLYYNRRLAKVVNF